MIFAYDAIVYNTSSKELWGGVCELEVKLTNNDGLSLNYIDYILVFFKGKVDDDGRPWC